MSNIAILSTGDAEEDKRQLEQAVIHDQRMNQGICPNGCAELVWSDEGYRGNCPKCNFMLSTNVPYGIKDENYISD